VHLGFEVRVELTLPDGREIWAQVTRASADELELSEGQILTVRLPKPRVFDAALSACATPPLRA